MRSALYYVMKTLIALLVLALGTTACGARSGAENAPQSTLPQKAMYSCAFVNTEVTETYYSWSRRTIIEIRHNYSCIADTSEVCALAVIEGQIHFVSNCIGAGDIDASQLPEPEGAQ